MITDRVEEWVRNEIEGLDLEPIKVKLVDNKEGPGWTVDQANQVEQSYKRFLFLNWKYLDCQIVPNRLVDEFWHKHILDTRKYAADCEQIFGYFLHHFPYFGMRGEEDAKNLETAFEETQHLYESEFGSDYDGDHALAGMITPTNTCGQCGSADCSACGSGVVDDSPRPRLVVGS